jgi:hypothetical protein
MSAESRRSRMYEYLDALKALGWVEQRPLKLRISNRFRKGIGSRVDVLTEEGKTVYRELFGTDPVDQITPFVAKYKTIEAGVLIQVTKQLIEGWSQQANNRWTCEVIDAVWDEDEALACIPGARRSYNYTHRDGTVVRAMPDLIVRMHPQHGKPLLAVIEVERGEYKAADLWDKWERAMRCYPPMMLYVVAPNQRVRKRLFSAWLERVRVVKQRYGLPYGANAAFYTLDVLKDAGLLSAEQLIGLTHRQKEVREKGEELPPEAAVKLPKYWCEDKSK